MHRLLRQLVVAIVFSLIFCVQGVAQAHDATLNDMSDKVQSLERAMRNISNKTDRLERRLGDMKHSVSQITGAGPGILLLFFCAVFCAVWAHNTGRNSWAWFFGGLFLAPIALLYLLASSAEDHSGSKEDAEDAE